MQNIIKIFRFAWEYLYDFVITLRHNCYSPFENKQVRLYYRILIVAHAIEKGLSLSNPRLFFGKSKLRYMLKMAKEYDANYSRFPLEMAAGVAEDYISIHEGKGEDVILDELRASLSKGSVLHGYEPKGGFKRFEELKQISTSQQGICLDFMRSRYSCRNYEQRTVSQELIDRVVELAQTAPSQCNRQSVRVHCYQNKAQINRLLKLQGGTSGFTDCVSNLFVITSEITAWGGYGQRNQGFVDGGLFGQSLMLACHAYGIGACGLNLAVDNAKEAKIKKEGKVHPRERLIMMIAFGYPGAVNLKGARSPRLPLESLLEVHG